MPSPILATSTRSGVVTDDLIFGEATALSVVERTIQWIDRYDEWEAMTAVAHRLNGRSSYTRAQLTDLIRGRLPLLRRIQEGLNLHSFGLWENDEEDGSPWVDVRCGAIIMRGVLSDREVERQIFSPPGPQLAASDLHSWVWGPARRLYEQGHHRECLATAAQSVEAQVQAKTGRYDLSGVSLPRQVFKLDAPAPSEPRLRLQFPEGSENWKSAHEGASSLGVACMALARNLSTHSLVDPGPVGTFEYLATLSAYARLVDEARVETG